MDNIRQAVRGMPSQLSIPILRRILRLPAPVARIMMNELTEPLGKNQSYIKKVYEGGWVRYLLFDSCTSFSKMSNPFVIIDRSMDWRRDG